MHQAIATIAIDRYQYHPRKSLGFARQWLNYPYNERGIKLDA